MQIISVKKTSPENVTDIFDNGNSVKMARNLFLDLRLHTGMEFDEAKMPELLKASSFSRCKQHALRLLSQRMMSRKELKDKLICKGEAEEDAENSVTWLLNLGFLDDSAYADLLVKHYNQKGYGSARIRNELYRHGIPKDLWEQALVNVSDPVEKILDFVRSKSIDFNSKEQKRKITQTLYRRGFSWSDIHSALNLLEESWEDE